MKIPSLETTEGVLLLAAVAFAAYVAYKAYQTGSAIGSGVKKTLSDIGDEITSVYDSVNVATTGAGTRTRSILNGGAIPDAPDQSAAELARLNRNNDSIVDSLPTSTVPSYDSMGNYQGTTEEISGLGSDSVYASESQDYSPSALGIA